MMTNEDTKAWCVDQPDGTLVVIGTRAEAEARAGVMKAAGKEQLMVNGPYEFVAGGPQPETLGRFIKSALEEDPEFSAWALSLPEKHWARFDLTAARQGWEAAKHLALRPLGTLVIAAAIPKRPHTYHICSDENCQICLGGLQLCVVCKCGEAELLEECPGPPVEDVMHVTA